MERQIPENVYLTRGLNVYTHIHKNINHKDRNHLYKDPTKVIVSTAAERRTDNEVSCKLRPPKPYTGDCSQCECSKLSTWLRRKKGLLLPFPWTPGGYTVLLVSIDCCPRFYHFRAHLESPQCFQPAEVDSSALSSGTPGGRHCLSHNSSRAVTKNS